jgi:hypothetical protein
MRALASAAALVALLAAAAPAAAEPGAAADYVNALRYAELAGRLRTSFDRWDALAAADEKIASGIYAGSFLYGYQLAVAPNQVSLGVAAGGRRLRFYGLLHTTNVTFSDDLGFHRAAFGASLSLGPVQLQADVGLGTSGLFYYAKLASAPLKTSVSLAFYPFREVGDRIEREGTTGLALPNVVRAEFMGIPFALLGLEYNLLLGYARPDIRFKLSALRSFEELRTVPYDLELRLINNMASPTDLSDFTVVVSAYYVTQMDLLAVKKLSLVNRFMFFGSASYRTGDILGDRLREEGVAFEDQRGVGFEAGLGLRVFGLAEKGFPADDYVKASIYYNFPDYQDLLPQSRWGARLTINY